MNSDKTAADRMKTMIGDVRAILNDELSRSGERGAEVHAPKPERLSEARARLAKVNGLELLAVIRSNPSYFIANLFRHI